MEIKYFSLLRKFFETLKTIFCESIPYLNPSKNFPKKEYYIFFIAFLLGFIGIFFEPVYKEQWIRLIWVAFIEEYIFRVLLQENLLLLTEKKYFFYVSKANSLTSIIFAFLHLFTHSFFMGILTFFPSIMLGVVWDKYKNFYLCVFLHWWYNICFFYFSFN